MKKQNFLLSLLCGMVAIASNCFAAFDDVEKCCAERVAHAGTCLERSKGAPLTNDIKQLVAGLSALTLPVSLCLKGDDYQDEFHATAKLFLYQTRHCLLPGEEGDEFIRSDEPKDDGRPAPFWSYTEKLIDKLDDEELSEYDKHVQRMLADGAPLHEELQAQFTKIVVKLPAVENVLLRNKAVKDVLRSLELLYSIKEGTA